MSVVATPVATPEAGTYTSAQSVALASATPGASIYYTLDGSDPALAKIIQTGTFTDARDGYVYKMVKMPDGVWWSAEDLRYNSVGSEVISPYGRVYLAPNAIASIPAGTWIPSNAAWNTMQNAIGAATAGMLLRSSTDWNSGLNGTDPYGFNAKPGGVKSTDALFVGRYAAWWADPATFYVRYTSDSDPALRGSAEAADLWHAIRFAAPANLVVPDVGSSTLYTEPLDISTSTTVKAVAVKAGLDDSAILTADYLINPTGTFPILTPCTLQMLCDSKVANSSSGRRRTVSRDSSFVFSATLNLPSECEQFEAVPYYDFPVIGDCEIRQLDLVKYTFRDTENTSSVKCMIVPNIMQKRTGDFRISCEPNISMDEAMLVATGSSSLEVLSSSRSLSLKCVWTVSFLAATQFIEWLRGSVNRIFTTSVGGMKGVACQIGDSVSLEIGSTDVKISADLAIVNTKQFPLNVTASRVGNVVTVSTGTGYTGTLVNRSGEIVEVVATATNVLTFTTYPENCYLLIREGNNVTEWLEL